MSYSEEEKKKSTHSTKSSGFIEWIVNFRFFGYGVITTNLLMVGLEESIPNLVMFGAIVLLIERQIRKK